MHHHRLVGGLASAAVLLTLLLVPSPALSASPRPAVALTAGTLAGAVEILPRATVLALRRAERRESVARGERAEVLRVARRELGVPYAYGGTSPSGFDCSGFTRYVYARLGIELAHGATDQARVGRKVSLRHLVPGDLVFYGSPGAYYHVGIYVGGGRIIHAPHSGEVVRYDPLRDASAARRLIQG